MGLFFFSYPVTFVLYFSPLQKLALLADPIGVMAIMNEMMSNWTIVEKNVRMFTLEGPMLLNRAIWWVSPPDARVRVSAFPLCAPYRD